MLNRIQNIWSALPPRPAEERFSEKYVVDEVTGCWNWIAALSKGYGVFHDHKQWRAHRWSYEHFVGPIPDGMQIHHKCVNTSCVNPQHLAPVTARENVMASDTTAKINSMKTHCSKGHELSGENVYQWHGYRICKACSRRKSLESYYRSGKERRRMKKCQAL